jgi:hypothetical protein
MEIYWEAHLPTKTLEGLKRQYPDVPIEVWNHMYRRGQHHYHHYRVQKHLHQNPHFFHLPRRRSSRKKRRGGAEIKLTDEQKQDAHEIMKIIQEKEKESAADLEVTKQKMFNEIYESRERTIKSAKDEKAVLDETRKIWDALEKFGKIFKIGLQKKMALHMELISDLTSNSGTENSSKQDIEVVHNAVMHEMQHPNPDNSWSAYFKSKASSLFGMAKSFASTALKSMWDVGKNIIMPLVWKVMKFVYYMVSLIFRTGFNLAKWIANEPRTAKMALIIGKLMKQRACKHIGLFLAKSEVMKKGADYYHEKADEIHSVTGDQLKTMGKEVLVGGAEAAAKSAPAIVNQVGSVLLDTLGGSIPVVGPLVKALGKSFLDGMTDSAQEAVDFFVYYGNVTKSFALLFDFLDPRDCLQGLCDTYTTYAKQVNPDSNLSKFAWGACEWNFFKERKVKKKIRAANLDD